MEQELLHTFKKSYFLKMSPNKHFLAQVNATQVNVFKYDTLQQLAQIKADNAEPFFSNDGSLLLIKESYKKLYIYIIRKSKLPPNPERSVQFSGKRTKRSVQKIGCTQHL